MTTVKEPLWDSEDRDSLRIYLTTKTGERLIPALADAVPGLLGSGQTNDILIRSGEVRGAQTILQALFLLAHPPKEEPNKEPSPYPSLVDDTAWNDGEKIEPTK
jgi:hypothetical protein